MYKIANKPKQHDIKIFKLSFTQRDNKIYSSMYKQIVPCMCDIKLEEPESEAQPKPFNIIKSNAIPWFNMVFA